MENIFENAKFGDKFLTRDGRLALYIYKCKSSLKYSDDPIVHELWIEGNEETSIFGPEGNINPYETRVCDENGIVEQYSDDIVGKKVPEELDDLELHEKAKMFWGNLQLFASARHVIEGWDNFVMGFEKGYRTGYSEAKDGVKKYELTYTGLREVQ